VRELKQLQDENTRLKKLVAELSLDKAILQDVSTKSGTARLETRSGGLHCQPLRSQASQGVQADEASAQRPVLPQCERQSGRYANGYAGNPVFHEVCLQVRTHLRVVITSVGSDAFFLACNSWANCDISESFAVVPGSACTGPL
jgi:hypothetical protein